MAWDDVAVPIVRGLIFDMDEPYRYADARLEQLIVISGVLVIQEVDFSVSYAIDIVSNSISPDPSNDKDFIALVALKTACMISQGEHRDVAKNAISVKDGPSTIDARETATHYGGLASTACEAYAKAKMSYQMGDGSVGRAIVGPYGMGRLPRDSRDRTFY